MDNQLKLKISHQPHQAGVPTQFSLTFKSGQLQHARQLRLYNKDTELCFGAHNLAHWPDGSIKWLSIVFILPEQADNLFVTLNSEQTQAVPPNGQGIRITAGANNTLQIAGINSTDHVYQLSVEDPDISPLLNPDTHQQDNCGYFRIIDGEGRAFQFKGNASQVRAVFCPHSGVCVESQLEISGQFFAEQEHSGPLAKLQLTFYHASPFIKVDIELHNPAAAQHINGQWDLGDAHAFTINNFVMCICSPARAQFKLQTGLAEFDINTSDGELSLAQYASGGHNWQSPVHVNQLNLVPMQQNGYQLSQAGKLLEQAERTSPIVRLKDSHGTCSYLTLEKFWQNFPKKISLTEQAIYIDLLPNLSDSVEELQGGEKLHNRLWLALNSPEADLVWLANKPRVSTATEHFCKHQTVPYLAPLDTANAPLSELIQSGLDEQHGFFAKREQIDEYGWRHFGDLYADHETAGYQGRDLFVSHYNNQYDPIFGFLRQYMLSGEPQWFELADDLARHVVNIDIYHTEQDKPEYNGGLFWHTDHYVKAYTSSHRSYSKLQESNVYQDHAGGGGPGGQHCYTTGLTYHYFLTAQPSSKQAVLTLTNWISHVYEGTNTCLELLLAIKNRHVAGLKNHLIGQYPLDRGTGNYIIALLDSFELTAEKDYLSRAEHVIQNTIHPLDDVASRGLDNIENCWFYTVLLQAVCRYLDVKRQLAVFDDNFYYARDALLRYAQWMQDNEYPYLDKPEILEFPNDTWAAQDLRKSHVFAAAWYYSPDNNPAYLQKAEFFQDYVYRQLSTSAEKTYTRVLALLMQNSGTLKYYQHVIEPVKLAAIRSDWQLPTYMTMTTLHGCWYQLIKRLKTLSVAKEYRWLMKRMGK